MNKLGINYFKHKVKPLPFYRETCMQFLLNLTIYFRLRFGLVNSNKY